MSCNCVEGRGHLITQVKSRLPIKIGDKTTSDVIVRLRTVEGRDEWLYCHSQILAEKSKYFSERLSEDWPTSQILDSRSCIEVHCSEADFNFHVNALRLLYIPELNKWHSVRNALGMLRVAVSLGCSEIADASAGYVEAAPWEEADEEEIIQTITSLGSQYWSILARLSPVAPPAIISMFISTARFATSSPPISMSDLKKTAQEQLEYMLTDDDDPPILIYSNVFKSELSKYIKELLQRFHDLICSLNCSPTGILKAEILERFKLQASDVLWACQILTKIEMTKVIVQSWADSSADIVKGVESLMASGGMLAVAVNIMEIATKVLESVGFGNVVLPTSKRIQILKVWLPFVQKIRAAIDSSDIHSVTEAAEKINTEMWQNLESAFVSILLTLPSKDQADILAGWLRSEYVRYPDLSEAFEVWCYRSKVARRRLSWINNSSDREN